MRPASVSLDCFNNSIEAEPSSKKWPARRPARIRSSRTPPQHLEKARQPLHLVQDDEPVPLGGQKGDGIVELLPIHRVLEVEVVRVRSQEPGQGRLADLPRTQQGDGGELPEAFEDSRSEASRDHPRNIGSMCQNCKVCISSSLHDERVDCSRHRRARAPRDRLDTQAHILMLICMRTTLFIDDHVLREARRRAADQNLTLSQFVERTLRDAFRPVATPAPPFRMLTFGDPEKQMTASELDEVIATADEADATRSVRDR